MSIFIYCNPPNALRSKKAMLRKRDIPAMRIHTTEERPLGVYHPNPSLHHIKKENIGLIEVMGLAVLPARLAKEINMLETAMLNGENLNAYPELIQHAQWAEDILKRHPDFNKDNAKSIIEDEIGKAFLEVLEDAGVFKRNENGQKAFKEFITSINES